MNRNIALEEEDKTIGASHWGIGEASKALGGMSKVQAAWVVVEGPGPGREGVVRVEKEETQKNASSSTAFTRELVMSR